MGDSMKRTAVILAVLTIALCAAAQTSGTPAQQTPPAAGQPARVQGATPAAKRPPQAKTQPEFDAYKVAVANTDPVAYEKAADDFAAKFPDSELRVWLYRNAMRLYQNANNGEKTEALGRKVLTFDGDDPEALVTVAEVIAERTRDTDLDRDQRYDQAMKMSRQATQTVDTDINVPAGTPQEKLDAYKSELRSRAFSIMGTIQYNKNDFAAAQENLQKSIDAYPADIDPIAVLRLALALDKQEKYPEALKVANRAVELMQDNARMPPQVKTSAQRERDRLQQLTGGAPPAQPASQPPNN
jgi:tetratricopeptide (TPR) repeat protein